jgi:hypothetical protein
MKALCRADRREISVPLIGENEVLGPHALYAGGNGSAAAVSRLQRVEIEIIVDKHAAPGRRHTDGLPPEIHLIDDFCDETGHDAVAAPRTIVEVGIF